MNPVLGVALAFTALFAFLTFFAIAEMGFGLLQFIGLLVLAVFVFGIFGAFSRDDR